MMTEQEFARRIGALLLAHMDCEVDSSVDGSMLTVDLGPKGRFTVTVSDERVDED